MLIEERLKKVIEILEEQNSATVDFLSQKLAVSKDTVRRDLIKLENEAKIKRLHGGAMLATRDALIFDYSHRVLSLADVKKQLAYEVVAFIEDHMSLIFDSSTTVEAVIPLIKNKKLHVITNSLTHGLLLSQQQNKQVTIVGGKLHNEQQFLYGEETVEKLSHYSANLTVLGVFAISSQGLYIHTEEEGFVKQMMVKQGRTVVALADQTKIGTTGFYKIADLKEIDVLITDKLPEASFCESLKENSVRLVISGKGESL